MISFTNAETAFRIKDKALVRKWLELFSANKGFVISKLSIVFCSDEFLLRINKSYLKHDYYTDIITFDYSKERIISGELFISVDRVKENAAAIKSSEYEELLRVIAHGALHLMGYKDKSKAEIKKMRAVENEALLLYSSMQ